jgi:prepilin-type N-terminal cleavage/methylation domain-containing protein
MARNLRQIQRFRRLDRNAFSLIEMLVVIGIILLLLTIGVLGFRHIERSNAEKQTKTTLAAADSMVQEMNAIGSLAALEGLANRSPTPIFTQGAVLNGTVSADRDNPGDVTLGKPGRDAVLQQNPPRPSDNVQARVMRLLLSNPKNKTTVQTSPTSMLVTMPAGYAVPFLADAWGNPIIYVPSGGLAKVTFANGAVNQTVTSTGQANNLQNRGFWASAGPDGNFALGDDNLYSFQK